MRANIFCVFKNIPHYFSGSLLPFSNSVESRTFGVVASATFSAFHLIFCSSYSSFFKVLLLFLAFLWLLVMNHDLFVHFFFLLLAAQDIFAFRVVAFCLLFLRPTAGCHKPSLVFRRAATKMA